jgi:molecular chaperone DnaK
MKTINFGIDLGTTNSLIAKFNGVGVEIFKNPVGLKETLPSCIAYRGDRIIIGDKAREWLLKDPLNVFLGFKRKMGTSEKFYVPSTNSFHSPTNFSALVLKELKNFIHNSEIPDSVVITIPASFDTMQSNATKKAGYEAGFKEVVLLQEPIAASLAFFNRDQIGDVNHHGKWLVYDLGGGTFDVALITIENNEMRVIDHKGDNFLGGVDFDHSFVMNCVLPKIVSRTKLLNLAQELNKKDGVYEKLYYILLLKAEEAKKELSVQPTAEIEVAFQDETGKEHDLYFEVSAKELNECIAEKISSTLSMIDEVLLNNNLKTSDIDEIIMIGGSTYIPYVREQVQSKTGIKANYSSDPTTAVVVGAAYYAGSKVKTSIAEIVSNSSNTNPSKENPHSLNIKIAYNKTTKDSEEYITGKVDNLTSEYFYRIIRSDGGFDSGFKKLGNKFGEFVQLRNKIQNTFILKIYDQNQSEIPELSQNIEITQGLFNLLGQPLPEDISIEVDDLVNNVTKCELIFERNSILPLTKTIYKEISRTVRHNSDDQIIINVLEGSHNSNPISNQVIGFIEINGKQLTGDLIKGSDIEIRIEISESRDVSVKANLLLIDYEVSEVFSPSEKYVSIKKLREEIKEMKTQINADLLKASSEENYEKASELQEVLERLNSLYLQAMTLNDSSLSDEKYQLEEYKRKLAQTYFSGESNSLLFKIKSEYYQTRDSLNFWSNLFEDMPKNFKEEFEKLKQEEQVVLGSKSLFSIQNQLKSLNKIYNKTIYYTPSLLTQYYHGYASLLDDEYKDPEVKKRLVSQGDKALERQNYDELRGALMGLVSNAKSEITSEKIKGTGLG